MATPELKTTDKPAADGGHFSPYIPSRVKLRELTPASFITGTLMGLFGGFLSGG